MRGSDRRERRRQVAIHAIAQADQNAAGKTGLGLGDRELQGTIGPASKALDRTCQIAVLEQDRHFRSTDRGLDPDPDEVVPVWIVDGWGSEGSIQRHAIARHHDRKSRHGPGHTHPWWRVQFHHGHLLAGSRRADRGDRGSPGTVAGREPVRNRGTGGARHGQGSPCDQEHADGDEAQPACRCGSAGDGARRSSTPKVQARHGKRRGQTAAREERDGDASGRWGLADKERAGDHPDREPSAGRHVSARSRGHEGRRTSSGRPACGRAGLRPARSALLRAS